MRSERAIEPILSATRSSLSSSAGMAVCGNHFSWMESSLRGAMSLLTASSSTAFSQATAPACPPSALCQNSTRSSSSHNLHPTQHAPNCRGRRTTRLRTPDTVELDWSQRGENEPQVGAWKEGLGGREFLAEMNQHGIVGRRAQAMEPHV